MSEGERIIIDFIKSNTLNKKVKYYPQIPKVPRRTFALSMVAHLGGKNTWFKTSSRQKV
jgi:hypothetical protein